MVARGEGEADMLAAWSLWAELQAYLFICLYIRAFQRRVTGVVAYESFFLRPIQPNRREG